MSRIVIGLGAPRYALIVGRSADGSGPECRPPAEKESGVRFKIAMMWVWRVCFWLLRGDNCGESGVRGESGSEDEGRVSSRSRKVATA